MLKHPRPRLLYIKFISHLKIKRIQSTLFISGFSLIFASKLMYNICFVVVREQQEVT